VPTSGRTILVVEDDPSVRDMITSALLFEGHAVLAASNGKEALDLIARNPAPRMILLDMRMPVMDGWQFARAYRERTADPAPIVVLTAAQNAAAWAQEIDAAAHLAKPFTLDALFAVVGQIDG
jgi:CheY-like chemotaxis protein